MRRRRSPRGGKLGGLALAAGILLVACAPGEPRWLDLARLGVRVEPPEGSELVLDGGQKARITRDGEDLWLATTLSRADWRAGAAPGRFHAALPFVSVGATHAAGSPYRLTCAGGAFAYEPDPGGSGKAGTFSTDDLDLELALAPGEAPPESCELAACLNQQLGDVSGLRLAGRRHGGAGFWVTPGRPATLATELPADSCLRFATLVEPVLVSQGARHEPHTFRVRLDGVPLFEASQGLDPEGESCQWREVELPHGGVRKARLSFEVDGGFALTSFLEPVVGPRATGKPAERP